MINFYQWLENRQLTFDFMKTPKIGLMEAKQRKMFGPVYHGTSAENQEEIKHGGFQIFVGLPRAGSISHGYELSDYAGGIPPPIHHLGFGIYFTTIKNIAKQFNLGTAKGLKQYYLNVPKLETINFGSVNTMMKWWQKNGYNMKPLNWQIGQTGTYQGIKVMGKVPAGEITDDHRKEWLQSTINLTNTLKSKYDAVWFKGKGIRRLLDGDQVCVYDVNNIYELDYSKDEAIGEIGFRVGDRILIKDTRATAKIIDMREAPHPDPLWEKIAGRPSSHLLSLSDIKNKEQLYEFYAPLLVKYLPEIHPEYIARIKEGGRTVEDWSRDRINSFKYNFPSSLVGKVLKKGERI